MDKSQVPSVKKQKKKALEEFRQQLESLTGQTITAAQATKKIHNLKAEIKKKTDVNLTGNKKLKLKKWEQGYLNLLKAETNPVFSRVPGPTLILS